MDAGSRRAAVIGHPVAHSLSPVLHRAAYRALDLGDWRYELLDVAPEDLAGLVAGLDSSWAGLSVTMPHKVAVHSLVHHVEPLADLLGVVNTVLVQPGDPVSLVGANTDVAGIVAALREGYQAAGGRASGAVVVGGGATGASALAALAQLGEVAAILQVRSAARAGATVRAAARMGLSPRLRATGPDLRAWRAAGTVVVTLPPGAADEQAEALAADGEAVTGVLLDCAYHPRPTRLSQVWADLGGTVVRGERMLLHQAAEQVRLMTGLPAPLDAMDAALTRALDGADDE